MATSTDTVGPIIIRVPAYHIKIDWGPLPQLQILTTKTKKKVVIVGTAPTAKSNGTVLNGLGHYQLLKTQKGIDTDVSNITFVNGNAAAAVSPDHKNKDSDNGGAIENDGTMSITRCSFRNNSAVNGAGGAIQNTGVLNMQAANFTKNSAHDGGALASTGTQTRMASFTGRELIFASNFGINSAGAVQNVFGSATLSHVSFTDHYASADAAAGIGGTIQNGVHGTMELSDAVMARSKAGSGGLLANSEVTSKFTAYRVKFSHGNATDFGGGAISSKGDLSCFFCDFSENVAHNKYPQGATLALLAAGAHAHLVNCTIDASSAGRRDVVPSEIFVGMPDVLLNLTFVNVTHCHKDTLRLKPDTRDYLDVYVRGSHLCEDGTYQHGATFDERTLSHIGGCSEPGVWTCGERALCVEAKPANAYGGIGVTCRCPSPKDDPSLLDQMWGFPYGGDDVAVPASKGFDGCFEQWATEVEAFATGCRLEPKFVHGSEVSEYTCCALRNPADHTTPVSVKLTAEGGGEDHVGVLAPHSKFASVSPSKRWKAIELSTVSFNGTHNRTYTLDVNWVPGDVHCERGERASPCYTAAGDVKVCYSQTKYPIDEMNGTTACVNDMSVKGPGPCGYAKFNDTCTCPVCVPSKLYACDCDAHQPDGTATCADNGASLSACDCKTPYAGYPPPPPGAGSSGGHAGVIVGVTAAVLVVGCCGCCVCRRRAREQQRLRLMRENLLNEAEDALYNPDAMQETYGEGNENPQADEQAS